jgi:pilus assembly protein CpaC
MPYKLVDMLRVALPDKKQIIVHVRVVDINKTKLDRFGVNWGQLQVSQGATTFSGSPWLFQTEGEWNNVYTFAAQVDALAEQKLARILSQPNLLVDDGSKATITVGGEIPVPISQPGGGGVSGVTIEWKQYGVLLEIEPTILEDGHKINLKVHPTVSSLDFGNGVTLSGFLIPALRTREADTVVTIPSGRSLILGGLLQKDDTRILNKIPLLGDLPIIGELFRHREFQSGESELVIMVTPEIVGDKTAQQ